MVVGFGATLLVASRSSDDDGTGRTDVAPLDLSELDVPEGPAKELVELIERGRDRPHHAVYEQSGGDRFEVWVDGDRVREDVIPASGDRRSVLRTGDDVVACVQAGDKWSCDESADVGIESQVDQLLADLVGTQVVPADETVAGQAARCFSIANQNEPVQICVTMDGVLARLAFAGEHLELVSLDDDVDSDVFTRPD